MFFENYISKIDNAELVTTITDTARIFVQKIDSNLAIDQQLNALLLGNVQSGKTAQMFGIMSSLADKGFRVFLLLTTDNSDLQRQTLKRAQKDLVGFNVLNEREETLLTTSALRMPTVIVLKKNASILNRWKNFFLNSEICKGLPLVLFDDEADAASLNTLVNRKRVSTINDKLRDIKSTAATTVYIEVTATPQAVLLQSQQSGWKPKFVYYFKPGSKYLGGNYFYPKVRSLNTIFTPEYELDDVKSGNDIVCPLGLRQSIMSFLVNCAHRKINHKSNCNFMIHPSTQISIHNSFVEVVQEHLNLLQNSTDDRAFNTSLQEAWTNLQQTKPDLEDFEDIKNSVVEILDNTEIFVIPLNSKSYICRDENDPDALDLSKGFNIVVGGNTLGRGITFPNLQTVYYCRTSKTPQADTFWQHSRIFGYDREKQLVRLFIPESLYNLFSELNSANDILINQIENGSENLQIVLTKHIKPTRKNVLDNEYISMVCGGVNMFASSPSSINTASIDNLISSYACEDIVEVDVELLLNILNLLVLESSNDFNKDKFIACINGLKSKRPQIKCKLIVRKNREISRNTGTMLSPHDRRLGDSCHKDIVLTMYRLNGDKSKGWNGKPLWMPNIKFPDDCCFYDLNETS
jgi:hypothetical protein